MADGGGIKRALKRSLARVLHPLERLVDRIRARKPTNPVIEGYLGYATLDGIVMRGRVLNARKGLTSTATDSKWRNLRAMLRLFLTDELSGVTVQSGSYTAVTDEEGYFTLILPHDGAHGWHEAEALLADFPDTRCTLSALVPPPDASFGVISDIDDTVLETGAYTLAKNLWTSLTGNVLTRHVYPDAKILLDRLHDGKNPVYFVSSSPWNMFGFLQQVFQRHGVLRAPMFLRDLGLSEDQFITGTHGRHKGTAIDQIFAANPTLRFVLIGDTGQEDAHVYLAAHQRHPGRVCQVILREPGPGPDTDSLAAIDAMKKAGLDVQTGRGFNAITAPMF